ncbi:unnamed protein product [Protopolystoma xenopodis]|uniref:TGF-beta family profile domain-containing protein n=1 Tax=Protopolystoma xenopodis TaxID=117903 RepID=A0A3S5AZI9_9PLAT|nr:unnamed protein product [Protopolystoma xenopodis]
MSCFCFLFAINSVKLSSPVAKSRHGILAKPSTPPTDGADPLARFSGPTGSQAGSVHSGVDAVNASDVTVEMTGKPEATVEGRTARRVRSLRDRYAPDNGASGPATKQERYYYYHQSGDATGRGRRRGPLTPGASGGGRAADWRSNAAAGGQNRPSPGAGTRTFQTRQEALGAEGSSVQASFEEGVEAQATAGTSGSVASGGGGNGAAMEQSYHNSLCQRREFIVNFEVVGWAHWVIAPQAYNARYCRGECPFPMGTPFNTTNHAVLMQLVHLLEAARVPGPCCVPNQLSSQSLLYHTQENEVVLRVYQDMVVESCACR